MIAAILLAAAQPAVNPVESLGWLSGTWVSDEGGRWTEEHWSAPQGGMMIGYSRSGEGARLREFEYVRIAPDAAGAVVYHASPQGGSTVVFPLVASGTGTATFENRAHDYPQRIVYRREGDRLTATISAADGSKPRRWSFRRAR